MTTNPIRAALAGSGPALGCFATIPDPWVAETIAGAGFAYVVLDMQHGGPSFDTLLSLVQGVELGGAAAVVRVGRNDPESIMKALDFGAAGVIVPLVDDATQARRAAEAVRYPPAGVRSFGPMRRRHPGVDAANADVLCLPMIETAEGLRNVDEIVATDGVDGVFFGPVDLGLSLGLGLDRTMRHPEVLAALDTCVQAAGRHGRFVATVAADGAHARELFERGVRVLSLGSDKGFLSTGAAQAFAAATAARDSAGASDRDGGAGGNAARRA